MFTGFFLFYTVFLPDHCPAICKRLYSYDVFSLTFINRICCNIFAHVLY